jgi:transposase
MKCYKGNIYDSPILLNHLKNSDIVCTDHIAQYKQYFLADPGYDSKEIRKVLEDLNYEPIIAQNRRNTKDPAKLIKLTAHEETIYKKRLKIENTFSKIKMNRRLCLRYDSKIESFIGFLYLSFIKMIHAYK